MRLLTTQTDAGQALSKLTLSFATTQEEMREAQRLRYRVFIEAMGLTALANTDGLDQDEFDPYCNHLIVRDSDTLEVIGTYRVLGPNGARKIGKLYSEQEFDLNRLQNLRSRIVEAGRACIHPDYRSGGVIMLLWAGLAAYLKKEQCEYLVGCASISLADGGHNAAALYRMLCASNLAPSEYRVAPHVPFPIEDRGVGHEPQVPPLIRGYMRGGAWVCGEPAWDPDFHCADLFLMLPLSRLDSRYARHYLKEVKVA